jgi:hypothetical protein
MQGQVAEQWQRLCEQAALEQDHDKLLKLIEQINRLLEQKEQRLREARKTDKESSNSVESGAI